MRLSSLSNRAACQLKLHQYDDCIKDCDAIMNNILKSKLKKAITAPNRSKAIELLRHQLQQEAGSCSFCLFCYSFCYY